MTLIIVFGMYLQIFNEYNFIEVKIFSKKRHFALRNFLGQIGYICWSEILSSKT